MRDRRRLQRVALTGALTAGLALGAASAALGAGRTTAGRPSSLPGLPPGAGTGYPAAPAPGVTPPAGAVGPAARIPAHVNAPGLLGSTAVLAGRSLSVAIACPADGRATITDPVIRTGTLARTRYRCQDGHASVSFKLSGALAARLRTSGVTTATLALGAGSSASFSIAVNRAAVPAQFWGDDGGLQCNLYGPDRGLLVAPNFTVTPNATIDVRPWVAFYTAGHGWQWLGTHGLNRSSWYQWTASPTGVVQWVNAAGALNRWSWAPISVPAGHAIWAIGGFEVVYLYFHTQYTWRFATSQPVSGPAARFCSYS